MLYLHLKFNVHRQKLTVPDERAALSDEKSVAQVIFDAGKGAPLARTDSPEIVLTVKDLGPQISWRTVFFIEYVRVLPHQTRFTSDLLSRPYYDRLDRCSSIHSCIISPKSSIGISSSTPRCKSSYTVLSSPTLPSVSSKPSCEPPLPLSLSLLNCLIPFT